MKTIIGMSLQPAIKKQFVIKRLAGMKDAGGLINTRSFFHIQPGV